MSDLVGYHKTGFLTMRLNYHKMSFMIRYLFLFLPDAKVELRNSRRMKVQWVLHNIGSNAAPLVSVLFWTIAYDGRIFSYFF